MIDATRYWMARQLLRAAIAIMPRGRGFTLECQILLSEETVEWTIEDKPTSLKDF